MVRLYIVALIIAISTCLSFRENAATEPEMSGLATITFAGGCFWCVEADFDKVHGVVKTISGYTGGTAVEPTYAEVVSGNTGHFEAVQIFFDPAVVTFENLIDAFWHSVDPTDANGQFCDRGDPYRTAIFTHSTDQQRTADNSKTILAESGVLRNKIATVIEPIGHFYPAEEYHQNYHTKNSVRYAFYRFRCDRDGRLQEVWGDDALRGIR